MQQSSACPLPLQGRPQNHYLRPSRQPAAVGLSQERLERIHDMVEKRIAAAEITGAVMLVARKGQIAAAVAFIDELLGLGDFAGR